MSDKCECPERKALHHIAECPEGRSKTWPEIDDIIRAALAAPCPCDQLRAERDTFAVGVAKAIVILDSANEQLRAENAELRQQALSRAAEVVQMLAVVRAAEQMMASHPSWCGPEPKPSLGCSCGLADLRNAIADYQESQQGRQA